VVILFIGCNNNIENKNIEPINFSEVTKATKDFIPEHIRLSNIETNKKGI